MSASIFFLVTGFTKSGLERRIVGTELGNQIANERLERLSVALSEKDKALQDAFRGVLTDMESPRIMYQTIRRLEYITDRETPFVDTAGVDPLAPRKNAGRVRIARVEKEIVIPTRYTHRFVMAIPLLSSSEKLLHILLIEEIRFIILKMFNVQSPFCGGPLPETLFPIPEPGSVFKGYLFRDRFINADQKAVATGFETLRVSGQVDAPVRVYPIIGIVFLNPGLLAFRAGKRDAGRCIG